MDLGPPDGRRLIDHGPKVDQPNRGSHSCAATGPDRTAAVPLPSSGASVAGPEKAISRARLHTIRCVPQRISTPPPGPAGLPHATVGPRADQAPRPLHEDSSIEAGT